MNRLGYLSLTALILALATPALAHPRNTAPDGTPITHCELPDATCYADHVTSPDAAITVKVKNLGAGAFSMTIMGRVSPPSLASGFQVGGTCDNEHSGGNVFVCGAFESNDFSIKFKPNGIFHGSATFGQ